MHSQRILTAIILIFLALLLVFAVTPIAFALLSAAIACYAAWEYSRLVGLLGLKARNFYLMTNILVTLFLPAPLYIGIAWWCSAFYFVLRYQQVNEVQPTWARLISGPVVLASAWVAVNQIRLSPRGGLLLLFLLVLIWAGDTAAFYVGIRYGKNKLAEKVSPHKTWEGVYGGLAASGIVGVILACVFHLSWIKGIFCVLLAGITLLFSVLGDLYESMLKREQGLKDSGQILPGHGGLLDRIDSLLAAAPIFTLGAYFLGLTS